MRMELESPDQFWMRRALELSMLAARHGEVPVGAVIVKDGDEVGSGWNRPIEGHDPSAHAEIEALRSAGKRLSNYRLPDTTLYVTLEPCAMCAGAIIHARVKRVVFGASDPKGGAAGSVFQILGTEKLNHQVEIVSGVLEQECGDMLREFFRMKRVKP
ncbi:MAG: tRNA adenosine(34) deaminase TadA [Gammaproteobacteria bacterium]|nr:tRNA adenosine(34) deaminase TadA [Gammaproteobacteria bacterium]